MGCCLASASALLRLQMSLQVRLCQEAQGRQAAQVGTAPPRPPTSGPGRSKGGLSEGTRDGENKGGEKGRGGAVCTGQHQVRPRPYPCFRLQLDPPLAIPQLGVQLLSAGVYLFHSSELDILQAQVQTGSPGKPGAFLGSLALLLLLPPQPSSLPGPLPHVAHYNSSCSGLDLKSLPY